MTRRRDLGSALRRTSEGARLVGRRAVVRDAVDTASFFVDVRRLRKARRTRRSCRTPEQFLHLASEAIPGGPAQVPDEITGFLAYAASRSPRVALEIGTQSGGTTFLLSQAIPSIDAMVGIDLFVRNRARLRALRRPGQELHLRNGSSRDPDTREWVASVLGGRPVDLLFIDGDHRLPGVLADFEAYRGFVGRRGLIAFHDIVPDGRDGGAGGPAWSGDVPGLWQRLRAQYPHEEFVRDWQQLGCGIGVIEYDPSVPVDLR